VTALVQQSPALTREWLDISQVGLLRLGYKASAEQFGPTQLLEFASLAENLGFDTVAVSDHFQPWRHHGGHAPASFPLLGAMGERLETARFGTSVLTPTMRYHPSVVAQTFATLGSLSPGRVFLGVGTGEAMNETPATALEWPGAKERRLRLAEAIELIRRLWTEERVSFEGDYYRTETATIYDRPEEPVPILVAAGAPLAAKLAGRVGDGFICTSGKRKELYDELLSAVEEGARAAERDPGTIERFIEVKVSYDQDLDRARNECGWWAALALSADEKSGIEDPLELERLADENIERAPSRFIVADDPDVCAARIAEYWRMGFSTLVFHAPGNDQPRFLKSFARDVMPRLRELASVAA
jgi:coenzyme F420-dependent glucose-6-phosphate dehydrogenase